MSTPEAFRPSTEKDLARQDYLRRAKIQDHGTRGTYSPYKPSYFESISADPISTNELKARALRDVDVDELDYKDLLPYTESAEDDASEAGSLFDDLFREYIGDLQLEAIHDDHLRESIMLELFEQMIKDDPELADELGFDPDPLGSAHLGYATEWDLLAQLSKRGEQLRTRPVDVIRHFDGNAGDGEPLDISPLNGFSVKDRP